MSNQGGLPEGWEIQMPRIRVSSRWIIGGLAVLWLLSGIYTVGPDEQGVVRRFGKHVSTTAPGIHYHLPAPIERVDTPKVSKVRRIEVGFRTVSVGPPARYREMPEEALMLTGDENIVKAEFIVQYKILDAARFLFKVRDQAGTVRDAAEAALRQVIGSHGIDEALTAGKAVIQDETKIKLQEILDLYTSGILVVAVQLQDVHPPDEVIQAFKDVASAKEDKQRFINEAEGYKNDVIPKARGEAERMKQEAQAYAEARIKRAEGTADRFLKLYQEYRKAKDVTRERLYLETMERVLAGRRKYIVPEKTVPLLNIAGLDELVRSVQAEKGGAR